MIKYVTNFGLEIQEVEITRETKNMVVYTNFNGEERKAKKRSEFMNYFDTHQDAKDYLVDKFTKIKKATEAKLVQSIKNLELVKQL
jgi:hypothetical protein